MKSRVPLPYFFIPLLYVLIIFFFLTKEFSNTITVHRQIGPLTFTAQVHRGSHSAKAVDISVNGISFNFSSSKGIESLTEEYSFAALQTLSYNENSLSMGFSDKSRISISLHPENADHVIMQIETMEDTLVRIPFSISSAAATTLYDKLNIGNIHYKEKNLVLRVENCSLSLNKNPGISLLQNHAAVSFIQSETLDLFELWESLHAQTSISEPYDQLMRIWTEDVQASWLKNYRRQQTLWLDSNGKLYFRPAAAQFLLAELPRSSTFETTVNTMTPTYTRSQQWQKPYLAPYLGELALANVQLRESWNTIASTYEKIFSDQETNIPIDFFWQFKVQGTTKLWQTLLPHVQRQSISGSSVEQVFFAAALLLNLEMYEDVHSVIPGSLWKEMLLRHGYSHGKLFFLTKEDQSIDLSFNFQLAALLREKSALEGYSFLSAYADWILKSVLSFVNPDGSFPDKILFDHSHSITSKNLVSSDAFPYTVQGEYAAAMVDLEALPDAQVWSASPKIESRSTEGELELSVHFVPNRIHHLIIQNIDPFSELFLYDIRWPGSRVFENFYAGWFYDRQTRTLLLKLRNRTEIEKIRIVF